MRLLPFLFTIWPAFAHDIDRMKFLFQNIGGGLPSDNKWKENEKPTYDKIYLPKNFFTILSSNIIAKDPRICDDQKLFADSQSNGIAGRRLQLIKAYLQVVCNLPPEMEEADRKKYYWGDNHVDTLFLLVKPKSSSFTSFELTETGKDTLACLEAVVNRMQDSAKFERSTIFDEVRHVLGTYKYKCATV